MNVREIKVVAVRGERDGQTGVVPTWPMPDGGINVLWEDGTITTASPGDIAAPDEAAQLARHAAIEARVIELSRMSKRKLLTIMTELARERGASWVIGGLGVWSADELTRGILDFEFAPELTR
jgi:hypothetical protein